MSLIVCKECNKEYSDTVAACHHCGFVREKEESTVQSNAETDSRRPIDALCLAGGIVALCSLILDFFGMVSVTAIVLSAIGFNRIKETGARGKGWAITGLVVGIVEATLKFIQLVSFL